MITRLIRFFSNQSGATAIEYALIAGGIALAIVASVPLIGNAVSGIFADVVAGF